MRERKNTGGNTKATMMDVAARAGVSQATVSLVLNGSPGAKLSAVTKQKVEDAAKKIGYQLVRRGQRPESQTQSTIVFIADELTTDPWMAIAFDGVREKALEFGLHATLAVSHGDAENEKLIFSHLNNKNILGVVYGTTLTRQVIPASRLGEFRTVLLNCYDEKRAFPSVLPGDTLGARMATEHLLKSGRKRVGFINGQQGLDASRDRLKGYRQALTNFDLPYKEELVCSGNWEPSSGYDSTLKLMELENPPDAIFCANDMMALGCFNALSQLNLKVPQDLAVIGFDDREIAQYTRPALTTFVLPHYQMGAIAAEYLIDNAGGLDSGPVQMKVECSLIERHSHG